MNKQTKKQEVYECEKCGKVFNSEKGAIKHEKKCKKNRGKIEKK
jgi:uncharacterized C2H2 Zn-finger protein